MSLDEDVKLLGCVPLFEGLPHEALRLLAFGSRKRDYGPGAELFVQGEASDGGYVVIEGAVELVSHEDEGVVSLGVFERHSVIGDMALITSTRRNATAVIRAPTTVFFIPESVVRRVLEEFPEVAAMLHERIVQSMRDMLQSITRLQDRFSEEV